MGNPIVHFEIRTTDPDAAHGFYRDLFGWSFAPGGIPGYSYIDSGVPTGTIPGGMSPLQGGAQMVTVFAGVENVGRGRRQRWPTAGPQAGYYGRKPSKASFQRSGCSK